MKTPKLNLPDWVGDLSVKKTEFDKLYKKSKNDKDLTFALRIYDELMIPLRNQELNGLRGIHIKPFQMENGSIQYYLDYTTSRSFEGGAKERGIKRPVPVPEKFALELLKHASDKGRINDNSGRSTK